MAETRTEVHATGTHVPSNISDDIHHRAHDFISTGIRGRSILLDADGRLVPDEVERLNRGLQGTGLHVHELYPVESGCVRLTDVPMVHIHTAMRAAWPWVFGQDYGTPIRPRARHRVNNALHGTGYEVDPEADFDGCVTLRAIATVLEGADAAACIPDLTPPATGPEDFGGDDYLGPNETHPPSQGPCHMCGVDTPAGVLSDFFVCKKCSAPARDYVKTRMTASRTGKCGWCGACVPMGRDVCPHCGRFYDTSHAPSAAGRPQEAKDHSPGMRGLDHFTLGLASALMWEAVRSPDPRARIAEARDHLTQVLDRWDAEVANTGPRVQVQD